MVAWVKIESYQPELMVGGVTGYIYFVQMDRIGPIKIGFTKNIGNRLLTMQVSSPYPLKLLCLFPGTEKVEKKIHACYSAIRMEGEWFLPHPIILKDVDILNQINKENGFIEPIPEFDLKEDDLFDEYYSHIRGAIFKWNEFLTSEDYQMFKREQNKEVRDMLLDRYIVGWHNEKEMAGRI